jgi:hypothetical protein
MVNNEERCLPDQWRLVYQPHVKPSSYEKPVPVEDMKVTIMIGGAGQVTGMDYAMLALHERNSVSRYYTFLNLSIAPETPIVYKTISDKNIIAPYYLTPPQPQSQPKPNGSDLVASADNSVLPLSAFEQNSIYVPACEESVGVVKEEIEKSIILGMAFCDNVDVIDQFISLLNDFLIPNLPIKIINFVYVGKGSNWFITLKYKNENFNSLNYQAKLITLQKEIGNKMQEIIEKLFYVCNNIIFKPNGNINVNYSQKNCPVVDDNKSVTLIDYYLNAALSLKHLDFIEKYKTKYLNKSYFLWHYLIEQGFMQR